MKVSNGNFSVVSYTKETKVQTDQTSTPTEVNFPQLQRTFLSKLDIAYICSACHFIVNKLTREVPREI